MMNPETGLPQLPMPTGLTRGFRVVAVLCAIFSAFVGALAGGEAMALVLGSPASSMDRFESSAATKAGTDDAQSEAIASALEELRHRQVDVLLQMETSRSVVLAILAIGSAMTFVASMRLLRPVGLPREGARRTLVMGAIVSAVCRTVDGGQLTVVAQRCASQIEALFVAIMGSEAAGESAALLQPMARDLAMVGPIALTVLVAGGFAVFAQAFSSRKLRARLMELDAQEAQ